MFRSGLGIQARMTLITQAGEIDAVSERCFKDESFKHEGKKAGVVSGAATRGCNDRIDW
jgi:hypothetical protein